ncbi:hypothetical protein HDU76_006713 [Blyttiomyces sp. JEL0837]|nr:hypothetical protein HDU76_006713 [Blyttiomyces sp. JEL0837]
MDNVENENPWDDVPSTSPIKPTATASTLSPSSAVPLASSQIDGSVSSLDFVDAKSNHSLGSNQSVGDRENPAIPEFTLPNDPITQTQMPRQTQDTVPQPLEPVNTSPPAPAPTDDFGDFGEFESTPVASRIALSSPVKTTPPATETITTAAADVDDEFGDFGGSDENLAPAPAPAVVAVSPMTGASFGVIGLAAAREGDVTEEERVARILAATFESLPSNIKPTCMDISASLKAIFPLPSAPPGSLNAVNGLLDDSNADEEPTTPATTAGNRNTKLVSPHPDFAEEEWVTLWNKLSQEQDYAESMSSKFRWKKSHIRRAFLKSLDIPVPAISDETTSPDQHGPLSANSHSSKHPETSGAATGSVAAGVADSHVHGGGHGDGHRDAKQVELDEAKYYCSITEDELRKKTNDELEELIKVLALHQVKLQEQANYWLDAKEQLVMDAEMHNKMIASLVQYATQQHTASPKGGTPKGKAANKHKKKPVPPKHH